MATSTMHPAELNPKKLDRLRALESKLDATVIALEPDPPYAYLDEAQVAELKSLEKDLGAILLAYKSN